MSRRRDTRLPSDVLGLVAVAAALTALTAAATTATVLAVLAVLTTLAAVTAAALSVRGRRTRSLGRVGGVGGLRVCRGGTRRGLLCACTSVERLVDYLVNRALDTLPAAARARFAEEWQDHRQHYAGWRLVWWALWVRATARRTVTALGPAGLSRDR
jgi:choline-glycine betaine transporter